MTTAVVGIYGCNNEFFVSVNHWWSTKASLAEYQGFIGELPKFRNCLFVGGGDCISWNGMDQSNPKNLNFTCRMSTHLYILCVRCKVVFAFPSDWDEVLIVTDKKLSAMTSDNFSGRNTVAAPSWALTNKPELTLYFCSFFLFASLVQSVFLSSLQRNVCLYLHPVLNPPGQHHDDPAKPLQCLRLCHTVEMELLFSDVRSSVSSCGISTGYSVPWQRLWFAQCHTALVMGGGPQWRYRLAMAPDKWHWGYFYYNQGLTGMYTLNLIVLDQKMKKITDYFTHFSWWLSCTWGPWTADDSFQAVSYFKYLYTWMWNGHLGDILKLSQRFKCKTLNCVFRNKFCFTLLFF